MQVKEEEEESYDEMVAAAEAEVMREQRAAVVVDERYFYDDEDGGDDGDAEDSDSGDGCVDERAGCGVTKRAREADNLCPGRKRRVVTVVQWASAARTNMVKTLNGT